MNSSGPLHAEPRESFAERVRHSFPLFLLLTVGPVIAILIAGWVGLLAYILIQFSAAMLGFD
jgi:hypothetical protein